MSGGAGWTLSGGELGSGLWRNPFRTLLVALSTSLIMFSLHPDTHRPDNLRPSVPQIMAQCPCYPLGPSGHVFLLQVYPDLYFNSCLIPPVDVRT